MSKKAYFLVGTPDAKHWSTLVSDDTVKGRFWLVVAVEGEEALSVGQELKQTLREIKVVSEEDLYHLILKLHNIALDNQVRLSAVGAFLSLRQWTFFSLRALVGLKRQGKPIRFLINSVENEVKVLTGSHKFGDLVLGVFGRLATEKALISLSVKKSGFKEKLLIWLREFIDQRRLPLSAGILVLDIDRLLRPPKVYQTADRRHTPPVGADLQTPPSSTRTKGEFSVKLKQGTKQAKKRLAVFISLALAGLGRTYLFLKSKVVAFFILGKTKLKTIKLSRPQNQIEEDAEAVSVSELLQEESKKESALPRKLELVKPKKPKLKKRFALDLKNRRVIGVVVFALVLALILGLVFAFRLSLKQRRQAVQSKLVPYSNQLELLKTKDESYLPQTRDDAKQMLTKLKELKASYPPDSLEAKEIDKQIQATEAFLTSIAGKKELQALPAYLDVSQFAADFVISDAFFASNKLWLLDKAKKALIIYDPVLAQTHQQALISLDEVKDMSAYKNRALLLDNGIYTLAADPTANPKSLIPADEVIGGASLVNSFGDYVYVYNPEKANIYRYGPDFKEKPKPWLKTILGGKYSQVISWAIDGDIWLSTQDGLITRYRAGKRVDFEVKGLDEPVAGPVYLTTTEDLDKLYLLVPDQDRVIQLNKEGNFISQVKNFVLGSAIGLTYDTDKDQLLAISGSVVYTVPF